MQENLIVGLDIGSRFVRMAAGQMVLKGDREQLHILGACEVPSQGINNKGTITNAEDLVSAISICCDRLERLIKMPIEKAWVTVNSHQLICRESKGLVGVAKPNGEIGPDDVERALLQARTIALPSNYEILHVVPRTFSVDGQLAVKEPVGMTGIRLEADTYLIQMPSVHSKNLVNCVHRTRLNIEELVLCVLANAEAVLTVRQKEAGVVVINLGASSTSLAVFEEGELRHAAILPVGADYITRDINLLLKISFDAAEKLKLKHGTANSKDISKKDEINLSEEGFSEEEIVSKKLLAQIIEARVDSIFERVDAELKKISRAGLLSAGAVLCGGGARLDGAVEAAKKILKLPVSVGYPLEVSSVSEKINDPAFSAVVGLIKMGSESQSISAEGPLQGVKEAVKKIFGSVSKTIKSIWK